MGETVQVYLKLFTARHCQNGERKQKKSYSGATFLLSLIKRLSTRLRPFPPSLFFYFAKFGKFLKTHTHTREITGFIVFKRAQSNLFISSPLSFLKKPWSTSWKVWWPTALPQSLKTLLKLPLFYLPLLLMTSPSLPPRVNCTATSMMTSQTMMQLTWKVEISLKKNLLMSLKIVGRK